MCGIAGVVSSLFDYNQILNRLQKANLIQSHRGPDAQGIYIDENSIQNVGLAHQRLSIIDLSESGNQPMVAFDGQSFLVYNGEVYNYVELRNQLQGYGYQFRGSSDTEVILVALQHWGIADALNRFNGMWAFAWLNTKEKRLYLARDRFGIKPLCYSINQERLIFASEIKTVLEISGNKHALDFQVLGEYLLQSLAECSEKTFFKDIRKIPAGSYADIDLNREELVLQINHYYNLEKQIDRHPPDLNESYLLEKIQTLFIDAVNLRMRSDVPVGVLLSGGVDSSSIVAAISSKDEIKLLSVVSNDNRFDESPFIDIMSHHINKPTEKVTLDLDHKNAFNLLEKTCWYNDEPVGCFANCAHFLLMEKAKDLGVTVILSGQGGDEILCGYRKYLGFYIQELLRNRHYNQALKNTLAFTFNGTIINQFSLAEARRYLPGIVQPRIPDIKGEALNDFKPRFMGLGKESDLRHRQIDDIYTFSVPILTHNEDRMSMAWSREIRVPFLDYRLVEFLISLPSYMKLNKGWSKYIFRKAMEPFLPREIAWRKDKQGFVNPESEWLKDRLKEKVLSYFEESSLMFKYKIVTRGNLLELYNRFCNQQPGKGSIWHQQIFSPLALEIWLRQNEKYIQ